MTSIKSISSILPRYQAYVFLRMIPESSVAFAWENKVVSPSAWDFSMHSFFLFFIIEFSVSISSHVIGNLETVYTFRTIENDLMKNIS